MDSVVNGLRNGLPYVTALSKFGMYATGGAAVAAILIASMGTPPDGMTAERAHAGAAGALTWFATAVAAFLLAKALQMPPLRLSRVACAVFMLVPAPLFLGSAWLVSAPSAAFIGLALLSAALAVIGARSLVWLRRSVPTTSGG